MKSVFALISFCLVTTSAFAGSHGSNSRANCELSAALSIGQTNSQTLGAIRSIRQSADKTQTVYKVSYADGSPTLVVVRPLASAVTEVLPVTDFFDRGMKFEALLCPGEQGEASVSIEIR